MKPAVYSSSVPETHSLHLKQRGWKMSLTVSFQKASLAGAVPVTFGECTSENPQQAGIQCLRRRL